MYLVVYVQGDICFSSSSAPFDRLDETTFETPSHFESVSITINVYSTTCDIIMYTSHHCVSTHHV